MSPAALRYLDIGPLAIERDGVVTPVGARRVSAALACLLVRANQSVSTDALVEAVWSDDPPAGADTTLESHLFRLRQLLEPDHRRGEPFTTVVRNAAGYRLAATTDQVDSLLFEQLAGEARDLLVTSQLERALARCNEALTLWRGEPWAPHSDEQWTSASTARLYQLRSQVTRQRIESLLQLGEPEAALTDVEPLLDADPLDEGLWELSILAAYRLGRVGQALETYTRARRALVEHTGLEPGPGLRDLQAKILDRDASLTGPARAAVPVVGPEPEVHVPLRRTELIGREAEVAQLLAAVAAEQLVTLVGPAGCGKTRLVIDVARVAASTFPDGAWFIDLTAAGDRGQLVDTIASTLGLISPEVGTVVVALGAFLRTRRMLIVLDNCEHLLDDVAELVDSFLDQRLETVLLATSREPLAVDGEHVITLAPLSLSTGHAEVSGRTLVQAPAVRLFLQRLRTAAPQLAAQIDAGDPTDGLPTQHVQLVAEICEALDGLPLAIELAAGQARSFTLAEILSRVRADSISLSRTGRGGARHHATLSGAIKLSVDTLNPEELELHQVLAVIPGPFTTDLAAYLSESTVSDTAVRLNNLAYRSLLSPAAPLGADRPSLFSQLATIRSQARSTLQPERQRHLEDRRDQWVRELAGRAPLPGQSGETVWFAQVDDDLAAVRATLHHCLVEEPDAIGVYVAPRLHHYWFYRGMLVELEHWTDLAAHSVMGAPLDRLVAACCHLGVAAHLGDRSALSRLWLDAFDAYPHPLSKADTTWLLHHMPTVVFTCCFIGAVDQAQRAAAAIRRLASEMDDDPTLDLIAHAATLMSVAQTSDARELLPEIDAAHRRAEAAGNHYATWVVAAAGMTASMSSGLLDVALRWSDVIEAALDGLGAVSPAVITEIRGVLQGALGQSDEGVRSIARSRTLARRTGARWPMLPDTPEVLRGLQERIGPAEAERAYQAGLLDLQH